MDTWRSSNALIRYAAVAFQEIIQKLVESSASFASKTEFSQAKYLKRKQQKYDRCPNVWLLVESNLNNMWMLSV